MDAADFASYLGLPGRAPSVTVRSTDVGREVVLGDDQLTVGCPWRQPDERWNGMTVVLPWYDVPSMFLAEPSSAGPSSAGPSSVEPSSPGPEAPRTPFPVADDLLARGFAIVVVPWWAEAMAAGSGRTGLAARYGPPAAAALADGWRTGLARSLRDVIAVLDVIESEAGQIATWGHSLGGKLSLFAAAVDDRVAAYVTHELGFGWEHSNWFDPWYFGELRPDFDCDAILSLVAPRPVLYGAGHGFDGDDSLALVRSVQVGEWRADVVEHRAGHRPPPEVLHQSYDWLATHAPGSGRQR